MNEYRTPEQFTEIVEDCFNGNWSHAAANCVEFGFYAQDLINSQENAIDNGDEHFEDEKDIALIVEMAAKLR